MTDLDAIRARHVEHHNEECGTPYPHCEECGEGGGGWPCDTAVTLAALDAMTAARDSAGQAWLDADAATKRIKDYHNEIMEQHAEREARLRAATKEYQDAVEPWLYGYPLTQGEECMVWDRIKESQAALSAALATTPEGE